MWKIGNKSNTVQTYIDVKVRMPYLGKLKLCEGRFT